MFEKWIAISMISKLNAVEQIWVEKKTTIEFGVSETRVVD